MKIRRRTLETAALAILLFFISGCTEERAIALKAAAEAFGAKATTAIDAAIALSTRAALGKPASEEAKIKETRMTLRALQPIPAALEGGVPATFAWMTEREKFRKDGLKQYDDLKLAYQAFAAAFQRLPEGSLLAAKDVSCSVALGGRLVNYMALAGKSLLANPMPLVIETAFSEKALVDATNDSVKSGKLEALDDAVRAHIALLKEQSQVNADVAAALADAAEAGAVALDLIESYDKVSIADLLNLTRRLLVVREASFGLSSQAQLGRLENVIAKLNSKPALAQAIAAPIWRAPAECSQT